MPDRAERLDAFMARANATYYAQQDPFADFATAPEISQVFGELLGLWAAEAWRAMGAPVPVLLAEAGPGRGTLMADALRAVGRAAPDFGAALRLHLIETSPRLRALAAARLPNAAWHTHVRDLPAGPLIVLANEFLDALPIRQFVRHGEGWRERFVRAGKYVEIPAPPDGPPPHSPCAAAEAENHLFGMNTAENDVLEVGEAAREVTAEVAARVVADGGAALFLDYGPARSGLGATLQAIRAGQPSNPLAGAGTSDLTAHVDFAALAAVGRTAGAAVWGPVPQGMFLARLGLFQRTGQLARSNPSRAAALIAAAQRLAEPAAMGRLFKALAIVHPALPAPAGFAP